LNVTIFTKASGIQVRSDDAGQQEGGKNMLRPMGPSHCRALSIPQVGLEGKARDISYMEGTA
jgi:hypothetical protein